MCPRARQRHALSGPIVHSRARFGDPCLHEIRATRTEPDDRTTKLRGWRGAPEVLRPQWVDATASANAADGVIHPRVCRGRLLRARAILSSSRCEQVERSAVL